MYQTFNCIYLYLVETQNTELFSFQDFFSTFQEAKINEKYTEKIKLILRYFIDINKSLVSKLALRHSLHSLLFHYNEQDAHQVQENSNWC